MLLFVLLASTTMVQHVLTLQASEMWEIDGTYMGNVESGIFTGDERHVASLQGGPFT